MEVWVALAVKVDHDLCSSRPWWDQAKGAWRVEGSLIFVLTLCCGLCNLGLLSFVLPAETLAKAEQNNREDRRTHRIQEKVREAGCREGALGDEARGSAFYTEVFPYAWA